MNIKYNAFLIYLLYYLLYYVLLQCSITMFQIITYSI